MKCFCSAGVVLVVSLVAGCTPAEPPPAAEQASSEAGLRMDAPTQQRMGVRTAPVASAQVARLAIGYARVLDVSPLAAIEAESEAARALAEASRVEHRRLASLASQDQSASARAVEAARSQAAGDSARAVLAARRLGLEWGPGLERMSPSARGQLLRSIAAGNAALLRIDAPDAEGAVRSVRLRDDEGGPLAVQLLGPAASADPRLQSDGLLGVVRGASAARLVAGRLVQADVVLQDPETGFLLPDSALLRADRALWVYVKTGADTFERRDVSAGRASEGGWFVAQGFTAQDVIVVEGATSLLAAEHGPVAAE